MYLEAAHSLQKGLGQRQIPTITGIRAVSVALVVLYHSKILWIPGGLGVLMFFVISGFLITWLLLKEDQFRGDICLKQFYVRRVLRICPAYYIYIVVLVCLLSVLNKHVNWPQTRASLLYVTNYYQAIYGDPNTGLSHTWSLGIEEQFYLIWPILFLKLRRRPKLLTQTAIALIVGVWVYRCLLKFVFHVWQGYFYEAFDTRMDHLLIGCLLAILLFHHGAATVWTLFCGRPMVTVITVLCLAVSVLAESKWQDLYRDTWGFAINPLLCGLLIPQLISLRSAVLVRWLEFTPIRYVGSISYSIYLYQQIVLEPVRHLLKALPDALQIAASIAVLIGIASCSYWLIEKPFLRLKTSLAIT